MFVMINDGGTAFGCIPGDPHCQRLDYAGSWSDYGKIPEAIDCKPHECRCSPGCADVVLRVDVGFDLYTGLSCFNSQPQGRCGYEINPVDCMLRECEVGATCSTCERQLLLTGCVFTPMALCWFSRRR